MKKKNFILAGLGLVTLAGISSWQLRSKTNKEKQEREKTEKCKKRLSVSELLDKYNIPKIFGGYDCEDFKHELINSETVYTLYVWEDKHGKEWLIPKKFKVYPDYVEYSGVEMSLEEMRYIGLLERYYLAHGQKRYYFDQYEDEEDTKICLGYGISFDLLNECWVLRKSDNKTKIYQINEEIHKIFEKIWEMGEGILNIRKDKFLEDLELVLKKGN